MKQLADAGRISCGRQNPVLPPAVGKCEEQYFSTKDRTDTVLGCRQNKSWERGHMETGAEKGVVDVGPGAEAQQTWKPGDGLLC